MESHRKPTTKKRKKLYYNIHLKALYYEMPTGSGMFTTDAAVEQKYKIVPISSILDYRKREPVNSKPMWVNLSFYPAHIKGTYGKQVSKLDEASVYWYRSNDKQLLVYVHELVVNASQTGCTSVRFSKVECDGSISKQKMKILIVDGEAQMLFSKPQDNYVVETKIRLL